MPLATAQSLKWAARGHTNGRRWHLGRHATAWNALRTCYQRHGTRSCLSLRAWLQVTMGSEVIGEMAGGAGMTSQGTVKSQDYAPRHWQEPGLRPKSLAGANGLRRSTTGSHSLLLKEYGGCGRRKYQNQQQCLPCRARLKMERTMRVTSRKMRLVEATSVGYVMRTLSIGGTVQWCDGKWLRQEMFALGGVV